MKKLIFIIVIWILLFTTSCSVFNTGKKQNKTKETTSFTEKKTVNKSDSLRNAVTELNKAINDNIKIAVQEVKTDDVLFNEKCTEILDDILSKINVQKSSGNNNYKAFYDLEKRIFELQIQIAETKNKEVTIDTNNQNSTEETIDTSVEETTKTFIKMIPLWLWVIGAVWFLPQIIDRLKLIANPLGSFIKLMVQKKN